MTEAIARANFHTHKHRELREITQLWGSRADNAPPCQLDFGYRGCVKQHLWSLFFVVLALLCAPVNKLIQRRKDQQGQSGGAEQAADDYGCQRALDFAAGSLRQRHGNEAERRDQGGHQNGAQP